MGMALRLQLKTLLTVPERIADNLLYLNEYMSEVIRSSHSL